MVQFGAVCAHTLNDSFFDIFAKLKGAVCCNELQRVHACLCVYLCALASTSVCARARARACALIRTYVPLCVLVRVSVCVCVCVFVCVCMCVYATRSGRGIRGKCAHGTNPEDPPRTIVSCTGA